jgi:hypothetical protein
MSKDILLLSAFRFNDTAVISDFFLPSRQHHRDRHQRKKRHHHTKRRDKAAVQNDVVHSSASAHQMMEFANRSEMIEYASRSFPKWNGSKNAWCIMTEQQQQQQQQQQQNRPLALRELKRLQQQHRGSPLMLIMEEPQHHRGARATPKPQGLMFSKTFKTGSSTATSVSLQIAHLVARREQQQQKSLLLSLQEQGGIGNTTSRGLPGSSTRPTTSTPKCQLHMTHEVSLENRLFSNRNVTSSLLWTIVRNPVPRAISAFLFYKVGMDQVEPSDANLIDYLHGTQHQQVLQLRLDRPSVKEADGILLKHDDKSKNNNNNRLVDDPLPDFVAELQSTTRTKTARDSGEGYQSQVPDIIRQEIMNRYDFVAVQDRLDESLVVLKLLFDLDDGDIIVLSSKHAGSYSWNWKKRLSGIKECFQIPSMVLPLSPAVQDYLQTNYTWQKNADFLLHAVANRSLDWTIEHVVPGGRAVVQQHVQRHRQLQSLVEMHCQAKAIFPCNGEGRYQEAATHDCYFRDMGCGYRCINNVLDLYRQGKLQLPSL